MTRLIRKLSKIKVQKSTVDDTLVPKEAFDSVGGIEREYLIYA